MTTAPTPDKWERRRAARRARTVPPIPELAHLGAIQPPQCLHRAFTLGMIVGIGLLPVGVGLLFVMAAFSMRAGYRMGRFWFTGLTLYDLWIASGWASSVIPVASWIMLLCGVLAIPAIAATVLIWQPEANQFYRSLG